MSNDTPTVPDRNDAPTNGWDTVFAINFTNANSALTSGWSSVNDKAKNLSLAYTDPDFGIKFTLDGVFNPWQLTVGGDGKNIRMVCPFKSGTYTAGKESYDLAADPTKPTEVTIEVGMEWVPDPNQKAFVLADEADHVSTIKNDLDNSTIDSDLKAAFSNNGISLSDSAKAQVVQNGLEWHITDGGDDTSSGYYIFYSQDKDNNQFLTIYKYEKSWVNNLKLLAQQVSASQPAVTIVTIANNPAKPGIAADTLPQLLSEWFNTNIAEFNHVFAVLDIAPSVAADDEYAWTKPTSTSYAVTDQGSMDTSIFGVLTMAGGTPAGNNHQVSPYTIPTGTDANGANAGFLISGPDFVKHMLLPGAQAIFDNADNSSFEIINDHLTVQNTAELVWGKFMMDNKKRGSVTDNDYSATLDQGTLPDGLRDELMNQLDIYLPGDIGVEVTSKGSQWLLTTGQEGSDEYILSKDNNDFDVYLATVVKIDKGGFKMSLNHTYVEIEFIGLNYSYSSDFDVHVNYTEQVVLGLKDQGGKQIFWFDQVLKNLVVSVTKTKAAITREIVEGAITAALSLVAVAGPIIEGLSASAEITGVTEEAGNGIVDAEAFAEAEEANPQAAEEDAQEAADAGASQLSKKLTNIKNAFATPKWKAMAAIAGVAGAITGVDQAVSAIAEAAAKNEWENVPGFDDFANTMIKPYTFPTVTAFDLKSAWLAESLQVGLEAKTS